MFVLFVLSLFRDQDFVAGRRIKQAAGSLPGE